ncbi:hypothetical protein J4Q44_G00258940, partial [Coregonus suidteri]
MPCLATQLRSLALATAESDTDFHPSVINFLPTLFAFTRCLLWIVERLEMDGHKVKPSQCSELPQKLKPSPLPIFPSSHPKFLILINCLTVQTILVNKQINHFFLK